MKKKISAFEEAKPRTPRSEARQREITVMKAMEDLKDMDDEEEYKLALAEVYGILPGHPRYSKALATWKDLRRGKP
jgi:hypothetical protein